MNALPPNAAHRCREGVGRVGAPEDRGFKGAGCRGFKDAAHFLFVRQGLGLGREGRVHGPAFSPEHGIEQEDGGVRFQRQAWARDHER